MYCSFNTFPKARSMDNTRTDHHPFAAPDTPSLHDLLDLVTADEQLDPRCKADLRSAIKTAGQWLGTDLTAMPAHPRYLRERLGGLHAAAAGVSRKRVQNARSAIAFALDRYGLGGRRSYLAPLSPEAQALYDRLPDKYAQCALSRFLHFISAQGIAPVQVSDAVSQAFLAAFERHSSIKDPRTTHKNACRAWNQARAQVQGWPEVMLAEPCYRETYGLRWADFPAPLEPRSTRTLPIRSTTVTSSPTMAGSSRCRRARWRPRRTTCVVSPRPWCARAATPPRSSIWAAWSGPRMCVRR
jgi:hypothetical protein